MARKYRKRVDAATKVLSPRKHFIDKVPVSENCEDLGLQSSVFYSWQKELFLRGRLFLKPNPVLERLTVQRKNRIHSIGWYDPRSHLSLLPIV
jgi:hypothetical protein